MNIVTTGNITDIDDVYRIEPGPVRKKAVASEELLSDEVTARHYFAGVRKEPAYDREGKLRTDPDGKPVYIEHVGVDANGRQIKLGEEMEYIDWKSKDRTYYVYKRDEDDDGRFNKVGAYPTHDEAMSFILTELTR